jgi:uncharacterized membrane protein
MAWLYVAGTITFTVYGQIVAKWRVDQAGGHLPEALGDKIHFLIKLAVSPWMISVFIGAFLAALCWFAALTKFELNRIYPFMALSFVFVLILTAVFFSESITWPKVVGILLIVAGLAVGSQA